VDWPGNEYGWASTFLHRQSRFRLVDRCPSLSLMAVPFRCRLFACPSWRVRCKFWTVLSCASSSRFDVSELDISLNWKWIPQNLMYEGFVHQRRHRLESSGDWRKPEEVLARDPCHGRVDGLFQERHIHVLLTHDIGHPPHSLPYSLSTRIRLRLRGASGKRSA